MTDVPAYALAVLCLLLGPVWLQGDGKHGSPSSLRSGSASSP